MTRCPRCSTGQLLNDSDGTRCCLQCGHVIYPFVEPLYIPEGPRRYNKNDKLCVDCGTPVSRNAVERCRECSINRLVAINTGRGKKVS